MYGVDMVVYVLLVAINSLGSECDMRSMKVRSCFFGVVVGEGGCCCVLHYERRYCDNWDYSYLVEEVGGGMGPIIMCHNESIREYSDLRETMVNPSFLLYTTYCIPPPTMKGGIIP